MPLTVAGCSSVAAAGAARGLGGAPLSALEFAIGDSDVEFSAGQLALQGTSTRRAMLAGYPKISGATIACAADFPPGSAPSELREYGAFVGSAMVSRLLVSDVGPVLPQHTCRPQMNLTVSLEGEDSGFTTAGLPLLLNALAASLANVPALTVCVGLGDGGDDFDPSQNDLTGANRARRPLASGYPASANAELRLVADFEAGAAPANMNEIGIFPAAAGGTMLWRQVVDMGPSLGKAQSPMIHVTFSLPT